MEISSLPMGRPFPKPFKIVATDPNWDTKITATVTKEDYSEFAFTYFIPYFDMVTAWRDISPDAYANRAWIVFSAITRAFLQESINRGTRWVTDQVGDVTRVAEGPNGYSMKVKFRLM